MDIIRKLSQQCGVESLIVDIDQHTRFVKRPISEEGHHMIQREYAAQQFLWEWSQTRDVGFLFLKPTLQKDILSYPYLDDSYMWLGDSYTHKLNVSPDEFQKPYYTFIAACHSLDISTLPEIIQRDGDERAATAPNKFDADAYYLIEHDIFTPQDATTLQTRMEHAYATRAFQHHDVVPWHMARHTSTNNIYLIDAGWSGISLFYYDIAYTVLQMMGYARQPTASISMLSTYLRTHRVSEAQQKLLQGAFAYRGVRLLAELHKKNIRSGYERMCKIIMDPYSVLS